MEIMTKKTLLVALTIAAVVFGIVSIAGEAENPNCDVCKPMMVQPGLMEHVSWDSRKIATGMISITTVDAGYGRRFDLAHKKMMENVERLENGEKLELCPMCTRMSALAEEGVTIEHLKTGGTRITAMTAQSPELIAKIHAHLEWAQEEFGAPDHHDHDHEPGHDHDHAHGG